MSTPSPETPAAETPPAVAAAVCGVPGVARMSTGPTEQFRSYLPGGQSVAGVRLEPDVLRINVVASWGVSLTELGERVRAAVLPWSDGREVLVSVDDLDVPHMLDVPDMTADVTADETVP